MRKHLSVIALLALALAQTGPRGFGFPVSLYKSAKPRLNESYGPSVKSRSDLNGVTSSRRTSTISHAISSSGVTFASQDQCGPGTFIFGGATETDGPNGNVRTFTVDGVSVNVSAFSRKANNGQWKTAYLSIE